MYKVLSEFPRWEVNQEGHIRNVTTKVTKYVRLHATGYYLVQFKSDRKTYSRKVHRLVAESFLPPPTEELLKICESKYPYKPCVNHKDHNKLNNHYTNLEWCDIAHNNKEAILAGVVPPLKGTLNGRAVLTEQIVHEVCKLYVLGKMPSYVMTTMNISRNQATKIKTRATWSHITSKYKW